MGIHKPTPPQIVEGDGPKTIEQVIPITMDHTNAHLFDKGYPVFGLSVRKEGSTCTICSLESRQPRTAHRKPVRHHAKKGTSKKTNANLTDMGKGPFLPAVVGIHMPPNESRLPNPSAQRGFQAPTCSYPTHPETRLTRAGEARTQRHTASYKLAASLVGIPW